MASASTNIRNFCRVLALGEIARAEVDEGDAIVAQQEDVPGVEVAVIQVVLEHLTKERQNEPLRDLARVDAVLVTPGRQPIGITFGRPHVLRHRHGVDELGHEHSPRRIAPEHAGDVDRVAPQRASHPAHGRGLVVIIDLLLHHGAQLVVAPVPPHVRPEPHEAQDGHEGADECEIAGEEPRGVRLLDFDRHHDAFPPQPRAMYLTD